MNPPVRQRLIGDYVATMDPSMALHSPGFVDIEGDRIAEVGPLASAPSLREGSVVSVSDGLLMPGMLNGHAHSSMTVLRGAGEGLPLDRWLKEVIWPREGKLTADDVATGMALGGAEMLLNGVTTTNEMYFFPEAVAEGAQRVGIRTIVGVAVIDGLQRFGSPDDQIASAVALRRTTEGNALVDVALGPHSAYALGDETLITVREEAMAADMLVHIHVAETATEGDGVTARTGKTIPSHLEDLGLLEARVMAAHGVWLTDADIEILSRYRVGLAHCPGSNGKIASGIAPIKEVRASGIPVSVSTDGPASNDNLDVLEEARLALLFSRLRDMDASALGVVDALRMVTSEAATALGKPELGVLAPGYAADIVRISLDRPEFSPILEPSDVFGFLVWAGSSRDVTDVWVGGRRVVEDGRIITLDLEHLKADATETARRIAD